MFSPVGGTLVASVGSESTIAMTTSSGMYQLLVDTDQMQNGDVIVLRCYLNVVDVGSPADERKYFEQAFSHVQGDPVKTSVPVTAPFNCRWTLEQTSGVGRSFPWTLLSL